MQKFILIVAFVILPLMANAIECTEDHPCTKQATPEEQAHVRWQRHKDLSDAAAADQKQRNANFEKHRKAIKDQENQNDHQPPKEN